MSHTSRCGACTQLTAVYGDDTLFGESQGVSSSSILFTTSLITYHRTRNTVVASCLPSRYSAIPLPPPPSSLPIQFCFLSTANTVCEVTPERKVFISLRKSPPTCLFTYLRVHPFIPKLSPPVLGDSTSLCDLSHQRQFGISISSERLTLNSSFMTHFLVLGVLSWLPPHSRAHFLSFHLMLNNCQVAANMLPIHMFLVT